jgi:hypothetical protein
MHITADQLHQLAASYADLADQLPCGSGSDSGIGQQPSACMSTRSGGSGSANAAGGSGAPAPGLGSSQAAQADPLSLLTSQVEADVRRAALTPSAIVKALDAVRCSRPVGPALRQLGAPVPEHARSQSIARRDSRRACSATMHGQHSLVDST